MILGWGLITATVLLVIGGCALYILEMHGWAQMLWVFASGTAGGGVVLLLEHRHDGHSHD